MDGGLSSDTKNALKVIKKHSKGKAAKKVCLSLAFFKWSMSTKTTSGYRLDSDDIEITAYIYVERPVAQPSA